MTALKNTYDADCSKEILAQYGFDCKKYSVWQHWETSVPVTRCILLSKCRNIKLFREIGKKDTSFTRLCAEIRESMISSDLPCGQ